MKTEPKVIQVRGKCMGFTHLNSPMMFAVAVQEFKPESGAHASVYFRWIGSDREFVVGKMYALQVVIHGRPREYEAVAATESA